MNKSISLSGSETAVRIAGMHCSIRNDGSSTVYASVRSGISAGSDGVLSIPAGQSAVLLGCAGTVYIIGTGNVQLIGSDYPQNFFKPAAGGSSSGGTNSITWVNATLGTDILAYAESAPQNQRSFVRIYGSPSCPVNYGYSPSNNDFWYVIDKLDATWISVNAKDMRTNAEFINTRSSNGWSGWLKCGDGGNAATLGGIPANGFFRYSDAGTADANTIVSTGAYHGTFANIPTGLPDGQGTLIVINYAGANENCTGTIGTDMLWLRQLFICAHGYRIFERTAAGNGVSEWTPVSDGGNAASIAGKSAAELISDISCTDGSLILTFADGSQKSVSLSPGT